MYLNAINNPTVIKRFSLDGSFHFHFHPKFYAKPVKNKFAQISFKKNRCCNMVDLQDYCQTDLIDRTDQGHTECPKCYGAKMNANSVLKLFMYSVSIHTCINVCNVYVI